MGIVDLREKNSLFSDYWSPKIVGELNDPYVKLAILLVSDRLMNGTMRRSE